jgi:hypothetical protein
MVVTRTALAWRSASTPRSELRHSRSRSRRPGTCSRRRRTRTSFACPFSAFARRLARVAAGSDGRGRGGGGARSVRSSGGEQLQAQLSRERCRRPPWQHRRGGGILGPKTFFAMRNVTLGGVATARVDRWSPRGTACARRRDFAALDPSAVVCEREPRAFAVICKFLAPDVTGFRPSAAPNSGGARFASYRSAFRLPPRVAVRQRKLRRAGPGARPTP